MPEQNINAKAGHLAQEIWNVSGKGMFRDEDHLISFLDQRITQMRIERQGRAFLYDVGVQSGKYNEA